MLPPNRLQEAKALLSGSRSATPHVQDCQRPAAAEAPCDAGVQTGGHCLTEAKPPACVTIVGNSPYSEVFVLRYEYRALSFGPLPNHSIRGGIHVQISDMVRRMAAGTQPAGKCPGAAVHPPRSASGNRRYSVIALSSGVLERCDDVSRFQVRGRHQDVAEQAAPLGAAEAELARAHAHWDALKVEGCLSSLTRFTVGLSYNPAGMARLRHDKPLIKVPFFER